MLIALIGKPSSGKSSMFKAATLAQVEIANFPFTTLQANTGMAYVNINCVDKEFNTQCNPREGYCENHKRFIPFKLMDIPGLILGSHEGKGKGNEFLSNVQEADALIHVVDISGSTDENGTPVEPLSHDPLKDIEFIENELDMWYFQILTKGWEKFSRTVQQENQDIKKSLAKQLSGLKVTEEIVQDCIKELKLLHHPTEWQEQDLKQLAKLLRQKTKKTIIAANKIDVEGSLMNLNKMKKQFPDHTIIPCSAESELALREAAHEKLIKYLPGEEKFIINEESKLNEKQKKALNFINEKILKTQKNTGVQQILNESIFSVLEYIAIFPGGINKLEDSKGNILPDCFLLPKDSTALDFAYKLHTDIGDAFVKAIDVKTKQIVGKDHQLKNLDVVEIVTKK